MICTARHYHSGHTIKEHEMRQACGTCGREVRAGVWWGKVKKNHLEYLAIAGRIIITVIFNKQDGKHLD